MILCGVIAYGVAVGTVKYGSTIQPWKIVFLTTGLLTVVLETVYNQPNARWLKKEDPVLVFALVRTNQQGGNRQQALHAARSSATPDDLGFVLFFYALLADIPYRRHHELL